MQTVVLGHGDPMPLLGLGTWKSAPGEVYAAVREAINLGYRHIDCALIYGNEVEIGKAIRDAIDAGQVSRSQLWITSKLWSSSHGRDNVEAAIKTSLRDLGLSYLDLYLIHWPVPIRSGVLFPAGAEDFVSPSEIPIRSTWEGMEAAVDAGLTRHIGVSNFSISKLSDLLDHCRIRPAVNQVELHPLLQQPQLLDFCREQGIHVTAYSPLGSLDRPAFVKSADAPVLLDNPIIRSIAAGRGCTAAQVLIAWHLQRGISTIPKSVNPVRLRENLAAAEIELSQHDLDQIAALDQNVRLVDGSFWVMEGGPWTLASLWDTP